MTQLPAIVVIAYNRVNSFNRLIQSIISAHYPAGNVQLIISIDKSDNSEIVQLAEQIEWKHGTKRVINHDLHLGLKEHVFRCGDLTQQYDSVILLEDDLLVSPWFYDYALQMSEYYKSAERIAGVSLYRYFFTENYYYPFHPLDDGSDVHFIQLPSSWGQMFSRTQWALFRTWLNEHGEMNYTQKLPSYLASNWTKGSWKKHFVDYMINAEMYFVYPNTAVSTNYGEEGSNSVHKGVFQVPLLAEKRELKLAKFSSSKIYYDANFEISADYVLEKLSWVNTKDVTIDLYGTKSLSEITSKYLLSSKRCNEAIRSFGNKLYPAIQNIINKDSGSFFSLAATNTFNDSLPERIQFFVAYEAISGILQNSYIAEKAMDMANAMAANAVEDAHTMYHEWCRQSELEKEYPKVICLIIDSDSNPYQNLLEEKTVNYPLSQIEFIVIPKNTALRVMIEMVNSSNAAYYTIFQQGDVFLSDTFNTVKNIFKKYPDISWLTGIQTLQGEGGFQINNQTTPCRRWNEHIFKRSLYGQTGRYIPSGATFFKRHLWDLAKDELNITSTQTFCEDLWAAFFKYQKVYTVDAYLSTAIIDKENLVRYNRKSDLLETNPFNRILEWFFLRNIPVLRAYYKERNELAPVVRYDFKTQSHWLSEY